MGDAFARRFADLSPERRSQLILALTAIADMMAPGEGLPNAVRSEAAALRPLLMKHVGDVIFSEVPACIETK